jgi:hypothetical protein
MTKKKKKKERKLLNGLYHRDGGFSSNFKIFLIQENRLNMWYNLNNLTKSIFGTNALYIYVDLEMRAIFYIH